MFFVFLQELPSHCVHLHGALRLGARDARWQCVVLCTRTGHGTRVVAACTTAGFEMYDTKSFIKHQTCNIEHCDAGSRSHNHGGSVKGNRASQTLSVLRNEKHVVWIILNQSSLYFSLGCDHKQRSKTAANLLTHEQAFKLLIDCLPLHVVHLV